MTPTLENALFAFCSIVWARCYATDKLIGEIVRRGRGNAKRAWASLNRLWYAALGEVDKTITVTPGGGPILRVKDVVSSSAEPVAICKLAFTDSWDLASEGEDIFQQNWVGSISTSSFLRAELPLNNINFVRYSARWSWSS